MARILIAEFKQETATFNPVATCYEDFRIRRGEEIISTYQQTKTELAGAIEFFRGHADIVLVPTVAATAVSGGPLRHADFERLMREFVDCFGAQGNIDGAYLCLHGAMVAEHEDDAEGFLLSALRDIVGDKPIVVSIDLHAILTARKRNCASLIVPYHTYPHVDQFETGQRSARNLLRLLRREVRPTSACVPLPMLVRGDELLTATGIFGEAIQMCKEIERSVGGLAAGVVIGNAFTDVPELQSYALVTTDNDRHRAQLEAELLARFMWKNRARFQARLTPLTDAIRIAESTTGLTIFSDGADATASGAPGDSNAILRGLIDHGFRKNALIPIVDVPATEKAHALGVGGSGEFWIGGTRDVNRFSPLAIQAYVKSLHDGKFRYEDGTEGDAGRVAVLKANSLTILVTQRPVYVVGRRVFAAHGVDPSDFDLLIVKSPNGYRTWYESLAARMIAVDVPGATSANLLSLPYRRCVRPIFPLDDARPSFSIEEPL